MSPRPFERPATIALPEAPDLPSGAALDGLWLPETGEGGARGGAVIAAPHPLMGGSMESPVTTEIALAMSDVGFVSLRFDWRGVGGSAGIASGESDDADVDYRAALAFMRESVSGPVIACGYSWGALAAARVAPGEPGVQRLVLVAPPPAMLEGSRLADGAMSILVIAGDRDETVPEEALRETFAGNDRVQIDILEGVDHFFMTGLAGIGHRIRNWFESAD
ncbi:MAG TPA: alpha/beta fold hydrolase [Deltaproteobacteria bacterium]|nr:alpha/beta fold hydrolase [Deltaproteobacteria bacterium]